MREQVVIVGAGIIGLAIALRLRSKGWNVTVLDQAQPGGGASSAALGNITPFSDHDISPATKHLAEISLASYPDWISEVESLSGESVDYDAWGTLEVAIDDEEAVHLKGMYEDIEGESPVEWLSGSDAISIEPFLNSEVISAIFYKTEVTLDTVQLVAACTKAVRRSGCSVSSNMRVTRLLEVAGSVVGVETPLGNIHCDRVVLAPGADLAQIEGSPRLPLERIRGEVIELRGVPRLVRRCLYCGRGFITPRRDGRILLGSNYDVHVHGDDECSTTISVRSAIAALVATTRIVPSLEGLQIQRAWKGWRPHTAADGQPVVGWCNIQGVCVATGFFGLGITLAPVVAAYVAELFEDRSPSDIAPFSPDRLISG